MQKITDRIRASRNRPGERPAPRCTAAPRRNHRPYGHVPLDEVPRILSEGMTEVKCGNSKGGQIFWVFQRPRLNKMALARAMEPSATTMDQNTPFERKSKRIASQ